MASIQARRSANASPGAEPYYAEKKYKELLAEAAEKCADDTKGQTCYICTQALHWKTKEGLVRGCACRGTAGFAHVSCLAEQAKILVAEAVTDAAEACAEDTKGQTCYICTQALHWKTKEGLVRMCACRGTAGFAHVSCLAEQAKILLGSQAKKMETPS